MINQKGYKPNNIITFRDMRFGRMWGDYFFVSLKLLRQNFKPKTGPLNINSYRGLGLALNFRTDEQQRTVKAAPTDFPNSSIV